MLCTVLLYIVTHTFTHTCILDNFVPFSGPYEFYCVQENTASAGDFVGSISVTDRDLAPATTGFPVNMLTATMVADDSVRT